MAYRDGHGQREMGCFGRARHRGFVPPPFAASARLTVADNSSTTLPAAKIDSVAAFLRHPLRGTNVCIEISSFGSLPATEPPQRWHLPSLRRILLRHDARTTAAVVEHDGPTVGRVSSI